MAPITAKQRLELTFVYTDSDARVYRDRQRQPTGGMVEYDCVFYIERIFLVYLALNIYRFWFQNLLAGSH